MNRQHKQPTRRSSRRNSIRLEHLPDAIRSKILLEFISHEALQPSCDLLQLSTVGGSVKDLLNLGLTSKQWSQWVYRDTPGLWRKFGYNWSNMEAAMTDDQLAALLRRINGKEVVEDISLAMSTQIIGSGLEPLRGSTVLRSANLRFRGRGGSDGKKLPDIDLKAIVSIVESFPPFSGRTLASPGLYSLKLFHHESTTGKKRWNGYKESLLGLQRSYRKNFCSSVRGNPLPCTNCGKPTQHWLSTPDLCSMSVTTYCTACHSLNGDHNCDDDEYSEEHPDTGILEGCYSEGCKKAYDHDNFLVCSTCEEEEITTCLDCVKTNPKKIMQVCSMCEVPTCVHCNKYHWYLDELAIHTCQGCKVAACGICRKQSTCEGMNCNNDSRWFCSDCSGGLKACSKCDKMRCQENCLTSCASCGDAFCSGSEYYDRYCFRELKSCVHCFRSFCSKKECANVRRCRENGCVMSVCDLCVADGKAKKMAKCKHCGDRVCDSSGCREAHRNGRCTRRGYHSYY